MTRVPSREIDRHIASGNLLDARVTFPDESGLREAFEQLPLEAFSPVHRPHAHAIKSLDADRNPVDLESIVREVIRLGYFDGDTMRAITELDAATKDISGRIRGGTCRPEREVRTLRDLFVEDRIATARTPEEAREALAMAREVDTHLPIGDVIGADDPPEEVLVNGPLRGNLDVLMAVQGGSKSYATCEWVMSLACGEPLNIKTVSANKKGKSLILNWEDPLSVFRVRFSNLIASTKRNELWTYLKDGTIKVAHPLIGPLICQDGPGLPIRQTPLWSQMSATVREDKTDLVVVDPLACAISVSNENDNGLIASIAEMFAKFAEDHDCAVLLVHHTSKGGAEVASQHSARGASALTSRARWVGQLIPEQGGGVKLHVVKSNYSKPIDPVVLKRDMNGVLIEVSSSERGPGTILPVLVEALNANPDVRATAGGIRLGRGESAEITRWVQTRLPWVKATDLSDTVSDALAAGRLTIETGKDGAGRKVELLKPAKHMHNVVRFPNTDASGEEYPDDEVPF